MLTDTDLTLPTDELPTIRAEFHNLLDRRLNIEAAAAEIQRWSDNLRYTHLPIAQRPIRGWNTLAPASQELYKLMCYRIICQLVEGDPWELLEAFDKVMDRMRPRPSKEGA